MIKTTRRQLLGGLAAVTTAYGLGVATPRLMAYAQRVPVRRAIDAVLPLRPVATGLDIGPAVARLVDAGAIDRDTFVMVHEKRGPVPQWVSQTLRGESTELSFSLETAPYNLNLLWPVGLATKAAFNEDSPLNGDDLPNFASTGGWVLGREPNGAAYFNAVETVTLTPGQSDMVRRLAENVFRPCCGNSAYFQDCNHGSAMLGLMELAAAQGSSEAEILQLAKTANGFWYPQQYVEIALYFDLVEDLSWRKVPAERVLSAEFSSIGGYMENVGPALAGQGLMPDQRRSSGAGGCAV